MLPKKELHKSLQVDSANVGLLLPGLARPNEQGPFGAINLPITSRLLVVL